MQQQSKWQSFTSLAWYDGLIEFLFRFVAKTSEPLLAAGIVYSAADVLSRGHLLANTGVVSNAWALTQALAIESSGGVVLVYGLTSMKEKDNVKAWLYLVLSALLAIAGGIMLFMQLASLEYQSNSPFMLGLFGLRCVVSVGYIYLCRTKHIRFADLAHDSEAITDDVVQIILAKLEKLEAIEQAVTGQIPMVQPEMLLLQPAKPIAGEQPEQSDKHVEPPAQPIVGEQLTLDFCDRIEALLKVHPSLSVREVSAIVGCSNATASKWMKRLAVPGWKETS